MIKNLIHKILLLFFPYIFTFCATTGTGPQSIFYTDHTLSLYSEGENSKKQGEACAHSILGLVAWGDASTHAGQKIAYVNKIKSIDQRSLIVLGTYAKLCTIVKGI